MSVPPQVLGTGGEVRKHVVKSLWLAGINGEHQRTERRLAGAEVEESVGQPPASLLAAFFFARPELRRHVIQLKSFDFAQLGPGPCRRGWPGVE